MRHAVIALLLLATVGFIVSFARADAPLASAALQLSLGGRVDAVVPTPDGGILIGGHFSSVDGVPRSNLARLNPDGSLDATWRADSDSFGTIGSIVVDSDGSAIVAGFFRRIGGFDRYNMAKLDSHGNVVASWDAGALGDNVGPLVLGNDGYVYVAGGGFPIHSGSDVTQGLAKISVATGVADPTWTPATSYVSALLPDGNGNLYVGGGFSTIGGVERHALARLSTSGTGAVDLTWNPNVVAGAIESNFAGDVKAMVLDGAGNLFIGGEFSYSGGYDRFGLAKVSISGSGATDANWDPVRGAFNRTFAMLYDGKGSIYVGGWFGGISGVLRANIAKVSTSGTGEADPNWNAGASDQVFALAFSASHALLVGGQFRTFDGSPRIGYAALAVDGTLVAAANVGGDPGVTHTLARQSNGGLILGGHFDLVNGVARSNIARVSPQGDLDTQWDPGLVSTFDTSDVGIITLAIDESDQVFVGGQFSQIGGQMRYGLAKLTGGSSGNADPDWSPVAQYQPVVAQALAADGGSLFVGGAFYSIGGRTISFLAKLDGSGTGAADPTWTPGVDNEVRALSLGADGSLYVGGDFTHVGTLKRNYVAKLAANGVGDADAQWDPNADGSVSALVLDGTGSLYAAGTFSTIGGTSSQSIAKLSSASTGQADALWSGGPAASGYYTIDALSLSGTWLYVGGSFGAYQGITCDDLVRLDTTSGVVDPKWLPQLQDDFAVFEAEVFALSAAADGSLFAGGKFVHAGPAQRYGLAEFLPDAIFRNSFE